MRGPRRCRYGCPMGCLVLVVEDDDDIREALRDELLELGCRVVEADNGRLALTKLQEGLRPDFVLLDLLLPQMSGPELLRAMKTEIVLSTIPVVLTSASRVSAVVSDAGHMAPVLPKPLRRWQLEQIVQWFGGTARRPRKNQLA